MKIILLLVLGFMFLLPVSALEITDVRSYVLLEAKTKKVLCENNSDKRQAPASMTKIMTMTLILEEIEKGSLSYEEMVNTSPLAASQEGSRIFLSVNEKMSVRDMLKGIAIASANDACVALAERISGSVEAFVEYMNEYVKKLGLTNTQFQNSTGLSAENHYSTSYDMGIMAANLINKFPEIIETTKIYQAYLREETKSPFWLVNTNKLTYSKTCDGLKTGVLSHFGSRNK